MLARQLVTRVLQPHRLHRTMAHRVLAQSFVKHTPVIASEEEIRKTCAKFLAQNSSPPTEPVEMIRSMSDRLNYLVVQLENGIRVCLISDPSSSFPTQEASNGHVSDQSDEISSTGSASDGEEQFDGMSATSEEIEKDEKKSAIVIGMKVGSFEDPNGANGLAHMLEHMLTMGSQKFPAEDYIDEFLLARGGYQNAHTGYESTVYEIEVHRDHIKDTIPVIAEAFVAPLLRKESIAKEIKAVDTEFFEAVNSDSVRAELILNHVAKHGHPFQKFGWGNQRSLVDDLLAKGVDLHTVMVDFYNKYYDPRKMFVVIRSQHPIDDLQAWAVEAFSKVPSKSLTTTTAAVNFDACGLPFDDGESIKRFNNMYVMESIETGANLVIHWCLPPVVEKYLFSPLDYYENLIGHEGKGSLISELRKRNLAVELYTDLSTFKENHVFCIFYITIQLTDLGRDNLAEVFALFFEYIAMLRNAGAQEYFYQECQNIALNSFNYGNEEDALSHANDIVNNMMNYPVEHMLTGDQLYYQFDKTLIDKYLDFMVPEKTNLTLLGGAFLPEYETLEEPWIKTKYQVQPLPESWREQASKCVGDSPYFHYPNPNQFIATNFELLNEGAADPHEMEIGEYPKQIVSTPRMTVWYKPDFHFNLPQGVLHLHILSPVLRASLENAVLFDVLLDYYLLATKEDTYDATMAEIEQEINYTDYGFGIKIRGFNEKLSTLLMVLLEGLVKLEFDAKYLASRQKLVIKMYNDNYQEADTYSHELRLNVLVDQHKNYLDRWPLVFEQVTVDKLREFKNKLLENLTFELHVQGNVHYQQTIELSEQIGKLFQLNAAQGVVFEKRHDHIREIRTGLTHIRAMTLNPKNSITSTDYYVQLFPMSIKEKTYLALFVYIINDLCFQVLRTNKGLGYRVGCVLTDTYGILGYRIYVGSCAQKFSCAEIVEYIESFVDVDCRKYFEQDFDQAKFERFVATLITQRELTYVNLYDEAKANYDWIRTFDYCFDIHKKEIAVLREFTLEDFKKWTLESIFIPKSTRKALAVQVTGNGKKALDECLTFDNNPVEVIGDVGDEDDQATSMPSGEDSYKPKKLMLLKSKLGGENFVADLEGYKSSLPFYPVQPAIKDLYVD